MAAAARADALERAIADEAVTIRQRGRRQRGGRPVEGESEAVGGAQPECICSITAEIMTDPVTTMSLALRPRLYTLDRALRRPSLRGCTLCGLPYPRAPLLIAKQADGFTYERSAIEHSGSRPTTPRPRASSSRASSSSRTTPSAASPKTSTYSGRVAPQNMIALRCPTVGR